jgi:signal transduction histidine kinase
VKLWQKIFLLTLALVILVVNTTSFALLSNNHRLAVERDQKDALQRHKYLVIEMQNGIIYTQLVQRVVSLDEDETLAAAREVINRQRGDATLGVALFRDQRLLYSINQDGRPFDVQSALLYDPDFTSYIIDNDDFTFLLLVSSFQLNGVDYQMTSSFDVSSTYQLFAADLNLVRVIGVVSALLVAGILLLLVLGLLRPLSALSATTRRIAAGDLEQRAKVRGHDEVAEVAFSLNQMADSIEHNVTTLANLAESRKIFMGNLAHEMKTPLTSILGFADILRIKRTVSDDDRCEYANIIVSETKRLQSLSGKLMELLSIGSIKTTLVPINLKELCDQLCVTLQPLMQKAEINLIQKIAPVVIAGDAELLQILLGNLIDNACKASQPKSSITLATETPTNGSLILSVSDCGFGIPADQIPLLTEPFFMLDKARTRKSGGAGLGLAICSEIARVHGATMSIKSELGKGTTVQLEFAADAGALAADANTLAQPAQPEFAADASPIEAANAAEAVVAVEPVAVAAVVAGEPVAVEAVVAGEPVAVAANTVEAEDEAARP